MDVNKKKRKLRQGAEARPYFACGRNFWVGAATTTTMTQKEKEKEKRRAYRQQASERSVCLSPDPANK